MAALARFGKYFLEGSTVGFAAFFIPQTKPSIEEAFLIAVVAAVTFSIVDLFSGWSDRLAEKGGLAKHGEDMMKTMRQGAALSIGTQVGGGLRSWPRK